MISRVILAAMCLWTAVPAGAQVPDTVWLEELTWTEVRDAIKAGNTTIILPTGGTEQNGPHMVLGKHNFIIKVTAERVARRLGNALVAPVVAYVPEGTLDPPAGHMRFPGTITLPNEHFMKLLEYAARSFQVHGFRNIVLLGDSGGNQAGQRAVAELLNKEWAGTAVRVHHVAEYYGPANGFAGWLSDQGEKPGTHASIADTSILMAVNPLHVRRNKLSEALAPDSGVTGDPRNSSAEYGRKGIEMAVEVAVKRIREMTSAR